MSLTPPRPPRFPAMLDTGGARTGRATGAPAKAELLLRPQRPLQQAALDAARRATPAGLGLDSAAVRQRMVQRLRVDGIACEPVLAALGAVPRHLFVDTALANQAYENTSLPIGLGQTISKPGVVARMLALLFEAPAAAARGHLGRVLEVGTGCGYQTALLLQLAHSVVSIERLLPLHERARRHLQGLASLAGRGATLRHGDGRAGHAALAPFDAIIAAAGGDALPPAWLEQLADGGRLVAPMVDAARGGQVLLVVDRHGSELRRQWQDAVHFVPLKSGTE